MSAHDNNQTHQTNQTLTKTNKLLYPNDIVVTNCWSGDREKYSFSYYLDAFEFTAKILNSGISAKLYIPESEEKILQLQQLFKEKYQEHIVKLVNENTILPFNHAPSTINPGKQIVKPTILQGDTVMLIEGCLPSKGMITCKKLILIIDSTNFWWAKNFNLVHAQTIEIWYNSLIHPEANITKLIHNINNIHPNTRVIIKNNYVRDIYTTIYNKCNYTPSETHKKYLIYVHGENRELFNIQNVYKVDIFKEIKLSLLKNPNEHITKKTLMVVGWAPNYDLVSKMHYSRYKDERIWENRRRAINLSDDLEEYLNTINPEDRATMIDLGYKWIDELNHFENIPEIEVEVYPECDLPIPNFNEFDEYIYLPPVNSILPNLDRVLLECYSSNKPIILPEVTKKYIDDHKDSIPKTKSYETFRSK